MSDPEGFLARWSRRKREAVAEADAARDTGSTAEDGPPPSLAAEPETAAPPELPPVESIEAASDITAFLAPGVPLELTRAALRRAWTADPVIRDFIGLSENAWDFNASDGVPGFGALDLDQVQKLLEQFLGEPKPTTGTASAIDGDPPRPPEETAALGGHTTTEPPQSLAGARSEDAQPKQSGPPRRGHGSALPQ